PDRRAGLVVVGVRRHVGAHEDLDAGGDRVLQALPVPWAGAQRALDHPLGDAVGAEEVLAAAHGDRRDVADAPGGHRRGQLGGELVAVLDAVEPERHRPLDDGRRAGVRGDLAAPVVRGLDDRGHLLVGQLWGVDRLVLARDAAGDADLDEVGARAQLLTGGAAEAVRPVGLLRVRAVAVTAGAAQRVPGGPDARS